MAISDPTTQAEREETCAAFTGLVEVCMRYRAIWCTEATSNMAMARLINAVELLQGHQHEEGRANDHARPLYVLQRILKRMAMHFDQVHSKFERLKASGKMPKVAARHLPPALPLPTKEKDLVRATRDLRAWAARYGNVWRPAGVTVQAVCKLHDVLAQYDAYHQPPQGGSNYPQLRNACIRTLLERIDPIMPRYAQHAEFSEQYRAARERLAHIRIDARKTFHVEGLGTVGPRHPAVAQQRSAG